jgi:hypothetical protein
MRRLLLLQILPFFFLTHTFAQPCEVNVDSLKGLYSGDCKKGKAEGRGTATGIDSYTGSFRNGYPEGQGKYTWKNGNWYEGEWKKGLFEGQGTLSRADSSKSSGIRVLAGFWKKGTYLGAYEKPYVVHVLTNSISDVNIRKQNCTTGEVTFIIKSITGGASSLGNPNLPKPILVDIQAIQGRYDQEVRDESSSKVFNKYIFRGITYPFYAIFSFQVNDKLTTERVGIEFSENCNWYVQVSIDQ